MATACLQSGRRFVAALVVVALVAPLLPLFAVVGLLAGSDFERALVASLCQPIDERGTGAPSPAGRHDDGMCLACHAGCGLCELPSIACGGSVIPSLAAIASIGGGEGSSAAELVSKLAAAHRQRAPPTEIIV